METLGGTPFLPIAGNQINWNQVYYFSEVAAAGSIKDAAVNLSLSPSTLSEHISQLEKDLRVQLFNRLHRRLVLTEEGARLFQHAKEMFESGKRLLDLVSPIPLGCYPVSIGIVPSPSIHVSYKILESYLSLNVSINARIYKTQHDLLERNLVEAKYDFGITDRPPERKNIESHLLSSSFLSFFVSREWADYTLPHLMEKLPLLVCNTDMNSRTLTEELMEQTNYSPRSIITSDYPSLLLEMCQRGRGIGIFSEEPIRQMNNLTLRSLRVPKAAPRIKDRLYAIWTKESENTSAVKHLKEILAKSFHS